ncbi:hypothetical protein [Paenibacillus odorifer]|uniref:hypothetical protein n=1 Tax=Paenibacillus odorifer TaxID=189426 RepID=UPI001482AF83|nr:hypothetical protein [Paenibacillus odorifer]
MLTTKITKHTMKEEINPLEINRVSVMPEPAQLLFRGQPEAQQKEYNALACREK